MKPSHQELRGALQAALNCAEAMRMENKQLIGCQKFALQELSNSQRELIYANRAFKDVCAERDLLAQPPAMTGVIPGETREIGSPLKWSTHTLIAGMFSAAALTASAAIIALHFIGQSL